jgi:hypothetical protein
VAGQAAASAASSASAAQRPQADFSLIAGIGPAFTKKLTDEGVDLRGMAEWTAEDVDRWADKLGPQAKIKSERWVEQARALLEADPPAAEPPPPPPSLKPTRSQVLQSMKDKREEPAVESDPLAGMSPDEIAALARRAIGMAVPVEKPVVALRKRGPVPVVRTPDVPTVVQFDRSRGVLKRLDRNKKFAFQIGDHYGAHTSQRGRFFDHEDIEIPFASNGRPLPDAEVAELFVEEAHIAEDPDEVHLANWSERKVEYPLHLVRKAVQQTYRKRFDTEKGLRTFLHQVLRGNQ